MRCFYLLILPLVFQNLWVLAQISFCRSYEELKPDIVVVLGDRYEIFSACTSAAMIAKIPLLIFMVEKQLKVHLMNQ